MSIDVPTIAAVVSATGVVFAGWQLYLFQQIAKTQFEDQLSSQYRAIIRLLPVEALLGGELTETEFLAALPVFFHYFDLCNEQEYLFRRKRVRSRTWNEWKDGIQQNLALPAFEKAWRQIAARADNSFEGLRSICPPPEQTRSRLL
jgi:hypothetical protein